MLAMVDHTPAYHVQAAARPSAADAAAVAGAAPPRATARAHRKPADTRQEVQSHGYRYIVMGNHLLGSHELASALQSGATPQAAVGALKKAYEAKGYFLVALVGKAQNKQVLLQVVQGRLTHVEGPPALAAYFSGLKNRPAIQSSDIVRQSILAQAYAATNGKQPQISFKPAPEVGGSTMEVSQTPLSNSRWYGGSLTTGNFGNRYAGHYLAQAQAYVKHNGYNLSLSHSRALTGLDENTRGAFYAATSGNLSKVTPFGTFQFDAGTTRYQLGKAFADLSPSGKIRTYGLSATQLIYADEARRWSVQEGVHHIRDSSYVFNGAYTLRDQKYLVWDASTDYSQRFTGVAGKPASFSLSGGVKLGGASGDAGFVHQTGAPTAHFQLYTASAGITQALSKNYSLQFNLSGQSSVDTLPNYEQWVLGGLNNISAYLPGTIVGDRGYLGRLTLQGPQWTAGPLRLQPSVFGEYGAARYSYIPPNLPNTPSTPTWQSLDDVGASLTLSAPGAHTSGVLAWTKPLGSRHVAPALRSGQRSHLFFYIQMGF